MITYRQRSAVAKVCDAVFSNVIIVDHEFDPWNTGSLNLPEGSYRTLQVPLSSSSSSDEVDYVVVDRDCDSDSDTSDSIVVERRRGDAGRG